MTIKSKKCLKNRPVEIDLSGPDGNAYVLLGMATQYAKQLGLDDKKICDEMRASNYENLLKVFDKYFGAYVTL